MDDRTKEFSLTVWVLMGLLLLVTAGCAPREPTRHELISHEHDYPYTAVMDDYHVRLLSDHQAGELVLVFEDISEKPIQLLRLESITAKVEFPDGTTREMIFTPLEELSDRYVKKLYFSSRYRLAGTYISAASWLKPESSFFLKVEIPFRGRDYRLEYDYRGER